MIKVRRGDIFYVSGNPDAIGSEVRGRRPVVVVQNNEGNIHAPTVTVVYLTTSRKQTLPTHVVVKSTGRRSIALCEQPTTISKERFDRWVAKTTAKEMQMIDEALLIQLGINAERRKNR